MKAALLAGILLVRFFPGLPDPLERPKLSAHIAHGNHQVTVLVHSQPVRGNLLSSLNVVESWNSTNGFIFYGKAGELATNRQENQEIGLLCLHLLQASLVYVNTLMIQDVLGDPEWLKRMTTRDLAALSPPLTQHINPYGRFDLDMDARIPIEQAA